MNLMYRRPFVVVLFGIIITRVAVPIYNGYINISAEYGSYQAGIGKLFYIFLLGLNIESTIN